MLKISPLIYHPDVVNSTSKIACGIINRDHVITSFANYSAQLAGYKRSDDALGQTKMDYRGAAAELGHEQFHQDAEIMRTGQSSDSLNLFIAADGKLHFLVTQKRAIFEIGTQEIIGCEGISHELEQTQLTPFTRRLFDHASKNRGKKLFMVTLVDSYADLSLSERESEVLFLLTYGNSAKQVAAELFLSQRTVECHINSLKNKLNIQSKSALTEFALFAGLNTQLPRRLVSKLIPAL